MNQEVYCLCRETVDQINSINITYNTIQNETRKGTKLSEIICKSQNLNISDTESIIDSTILFKWHRIVLKELHQSHIGVTKIK